MHPNPQVSIVKDPDYKEGYANSVQVRVSFWDFFLQFGKIGAQTAEQVELNVSQGIYLSPQQAKALHTVLTENLKQYEQAFGEIKFDANRTRPEAIQ
jgi:flagellar protein FlaG